MNSKPQWRFRAMQPGEMNVDPIEGEFFTIEALRNVTDAIVRESIQNSLDASASSDPVTVRISITRIRSPVLIQVSFGKYTLTVFLRIFIPSIQRRTAWQNRDVVLMLPKICGFVYYRTIKKNGFKPSMQ